MSLLRLPPETLQQIFEYVGSPFFHEDVTRLTVCKQWFEFARLTYYQSVTFSPETLHIFLSSGKTTTPGSFRDTVEALTLDLGVYQAPVYASEIRRKSTSHLTTQQRAIRGIKDRNLRESLDEHLQQLAAIVQQAPRLRFLRIMTYGSPKPDPFDGPEDHLPLSSIQAALSVQHLNVLVLDLPGGVLAPSRDLGQSCHICPAIGALLHQLRYLRLRMRSICPDVLKPRNHVEKLRLSRVIINLSLKMDVPGITSWAHSKRCVPFEGEGGYVQLKTDIQEQAKALAVKMASPGTIRILTHTLMKLETQSLDILTDEIMALEDDSKWDEDGTIVKKEDSSVESDYSDNSSTFYDM